jgi:chromate transporter
VSPIVSLSRGMGAWKYALAAAVALFVWWSGVSPIWLIIVAAVVGVAIELFNSRKHVER